MSTISSVSSLPMMPPGGISGPQSFRPPVNLPGSSEGAPGIKQPGGSDFGELLGKVVDTVQSRQAAAEEATRSVLAGDNDRIHQSMIAMQESSVAFSLMVEVRNRLVESYQELMRMPV